ncbi:MAG: hypothetical protein ACYC6N_12090 [Pirellulaceae bacterium]
MVANVKSKVIRCRLTGWDGNPLTLLRAFTLAAHFGGWTRKEIAAVVCDALSRDFRHFLNTVTTHCVVEVYEE